MASPPDGCQSSGWIFPVLSTDEAWCWGPWSVQRPEPAAPAMHEELSSICEAVKATGEQIATALAGVTAARDKIGGDAASAPTMFSVEELARRWNVDDKTIRRAIQLKQIPVVRVGTKIIRICRAAIEEIERGRDAPLRGNDGGKSR